MTISKKDLNTNPICFIYGVDLGSKEANVHQTLCMLNSLARQNEVTLLANWVSRSAFKATLEFFSIDQKFKVVRLPVPLITKWLIFEKITRLVYCIMCFIYLKGNAGQTRATHHHTVQGKVNPRVSKWADDLILIIQ